MQTPKQIYLKCKSCDKAHEYQCPKGQLHALEVQWYYPNAKKEILDQIPIEGASYIVRLQPSLTLDTAQPFWAIYLPPLAFLNGIETEADIQAIRFCLCHLTKIVVLAEHTALVKVEVLKVMGFEERHTFQNPDLQWWSLLNVENYTKYGNTENFDAYSLLNINIQGDLGISAIVKREPADFVMVAINEWDFHLNSWSLCHIPLHRLDCAQYGIG